MSVSTRLNRLKGIAYDVTRASVRAATPVVSAAAARLRDRLQGAPGPVPAGPAASDPEPADRPGPERATGPTPASVARNIAPHPPEHAPAPKSPGPRSAPGAKLPPRRRTDDD